MHGKVRHKRVFSKTSIPRHRRQMPQRTDLSERFQRVVRQDRAVQYDDRSRRFAHVLREVCKSERRGNVSEHQPSTGQHGERFRLHISHIGEVVCTAVVRLLLHPARGAAEYLLLHRYRRRRSYRADQMLFRHVAAPAHLCYPHRHIGFHRVVLGDVVK